MTRRLLIAHAPSLLRKGLKVAAGERFDPDGEPTNALYVAAQSLRRALAWKRPDLAVVLDDASEPASDAGRAQKPGLLRLFESHGFHVVNVEDALLGVASYAKAALAAGCDVVAMGSDKRLAQLVGPKTWWYDAYKDVRYTSELVEKRFDVGPAHVAGWLALTGDDDLLPGVAGIGKKGASDLVARWGSIDGALEHAEEVEGRTGKMLRASLEVARREVARARLSGEGRLEQPIDELVYRAPSGADLNAYYAQLGFHELLTATAESSGASVTICDTRQAALESLAALGRGVVALQVITEDPSAPRGDLVGLAVSRGDGTAHYFPFAGKGPTVDVADVGPWLEDASAPKVGHGVKSATTAFARRGISVRGVVGDSADASHLLEPSGFAPHDLTLVARLRLQRALREDDAVRGVGMRRKRWADLPTHQVGEHAGAWADAAAALWESFRAEVPRPLLDEYLELGEVLVRAELHGMLCDADDLTQAGDDFTKIARDLEEEIFRLAGKTFNLGSTKQLGSVLYEDLALPIYKRTKTGWSTATEALERIEHAHPIVPLVIRSRQLQRLKDSWVTALIASISPDGRVHSTVDPARSFSGRLVNSSPDLGRVPGKTPEMERIRHAFRAPAGHALLSVDYKQLGLYVLAHLTKDPALVEPLASGADMHVWTAATVLELDRDAVGARERQIGKVVNFATFAGQGASALALSLGLSPPEAKALLGRFDARYARVRAFQDEQLELVRTRGYIETVAGRRWPMGGLDSQDAALRSAAERMARRATHEGSVADVSRRGLLRADQALRAAGLHAVALLQVHDEVLFEVPLEELAETARVAAEAMQTAFALEVPLRVGCEAGPNWADLAPL